MVDIIQSLEGELGDLGEYQFRIRGTLIYYDGKTALEMSDGRAFGDQLEQGRPTFQKPS